MLILLTRQLGKKCGTGIDKSVRAVLVQHCPNVLLLYADSPREKIMSHDHHERREGLDWCAIEITLTVRAKCIGATLAWSIGALRCD
jgi:hypothetical protein